MSFDRVPLGEVCEIAMGQAPSGETYNTHGEGLPLIAGAGDFGTLSPEATKFTNAPTKVSREGDIILCIRATIGDRNWSDTEYCLGRGVAGLTARAKRLDQGYLWHWLGHAAPELKSKGRGATFLQVNKADIATLVIPLPTLAEQRRIAAILDKADALRAKRREALVKLDQLVQSVFLEILGDPVSNSMGWKMVRFGEVTESRLGKMLDKRTSQGAYMKPYLANLNVQWGRFEIDSLRTMNFDPDDQVEFALRDGDLLMCEGGEPGRCAVWRDQVKDCYYQKALHRIRCDLERCVPEYIQHLFWFLAKAGAFRDSVASATIAHLPGVKLKAISIPLPPISLQQRFSQVVNEILKEKSLHSVSGAELDKFFESLQQQAFSGSL